jgi:hypothetical protein
MIDPYFEIDLVELLSQVYDIAFNLCTSKCLLSGRIINNDTWNFLGEILQRVYFICALVDNLYSYFVSAMIISTTTSFGIVLGMTT